MTDLAEAFPTREWGVTLVVGSTPEQLANPTKDEGYLQMAPGEFLAIIDGVGRMHVTSDVVTLEPEPGHDLQEMDYLVYGWAPRLIRILRAEFTLHASAIAVGTSAAVVMGFSGAGKSTTVTALTHRGYDLIVDDVVPVDFIDGVPFAEGWERPVHLTDEAAAHFGVTTSDRVGNLTESKLSTTLPSVSGARPLVVAVELLVDDEATDVTVQRLAGADRLQAILNNSNGAGYSASDGRAVQFFAWATRLASAVDVHRITRPSTGWHLDAVLGHLDDILTTID